MHEGRRFPLIKTPDVLPVEVVFRIWIVFVTPRKRHIHDIPPRLLNAKTPLVVAWIIVTNNLVSAVVLPSITIDTCLKIPGSKPVSVAIIEVVANTLLGIVVQHRCPTDKRRPDPLVRIKLPFRKRKWF